MAFQPLEIVRHSGDDGNVAIFLGELQKLPGVGQARRKTIQRTDDLLQPRALPSQFLCALRLIPDVGLFQFAHHFHETLLLVRVVKDTP